MGLFGSLLRRRTDAGVKAWREKWAAAVAALDETAAADLERALQQQPPLADDVEIEQEMLDALREVIALERDLGAGNPPLVETTHRVVGKDPCHFSSPASMPDDPAQPTGRLLFTSARAVFAGGSRVPSLPWHGVRDIVQTGRDILFVTRTDSADGQRFRCNSYGEALCGAAIARYLVRQSRTRQL